MGTSLTVERYAEMRAEMEAGRLRDEVLARAGVGSEEWIEAQRDWLQKMGSEIEVGRFELSSRYSRAFLERQQAIAAASAPEPTTRRAERLPAPVQGPLPVAVPPQPPLPLAAPAQMTFPSAAAPRAPLPLAAAPQPEPPRIAAMGRGRRADALGQTLPGVELASGPALPFQHKAAGSPPPTPAGPAVETGKPGSEPKKPSTLDQTLDPTSHPADPAGPTFWQVGVQRQGIEPARGSAAVRRAAGA
jgi:hypothetical protein